VCLWLGNLLDLRSRGFPGQKPSLVCFCPLRNHTCVVLLLKTMVTPDYAVTGWCMAFIDGEHLKTVQNVLEPGCARTWHLSNSVMFLNNCNSLGE
jgi:hypothetical protein